MSTQLSALDAAYAVLLQAGQPLNNKEITRRVLEQSLWQTTGKTPGSTLNARITVDIKKKGEKSRFQRTKKGIYALREWGMPEYKPVRKKAAAKQSKPESPLQQTFVYANAAEKVLAEYANEQPAHYQEIADKMLELGLVSTQGSTPDATLNAILVQEIAQARQQGEIPRFYSQGRGYYGLNAWMGEGISYRIAQHNRKIRKKLLAQLQEMDGVAFEHLIGRLLIALGFQDVVVAPSSVEDSIDLHGTLVVGTVIQTRMVVRVVRLKSGKNIRKSTVQKLRDSLDAHEQGLLITPCDFSDGALNESHRNDVAPVALLGGEELVRVLIAHDIGIERKQYDLIDIADSDKLAS